MHIIGCDSKVDRIKETSFMTIDALKSENHFGVCEVELISETSQWQWRI